MEDLIKKAETLKKIHKTKSVYNITVEGEDKTYSCWLRKPTITELSGLFAMGNSDPLGANQILFNTCWLEGDEEIKNDDDLLLAALRQTAALFEHRISEVKKY